MRALPLLIFLALVAGCGKSSLYSEMVYSEKPADKPVARVFLAPEIGGRLYAGGPSGARLPNIGSIENGYYLSAGHYTFQGWCSREYPMKDDSTTSWTGFDVAFAFYLRVIPEKTYFVDCQPTESGPNFVVTVDGSTMKLNWHSIDGRVVD